MLEDSLKAQLASLLGRITRDVELVATLDSGRSSTELRELLNDIAELSPRISVTDTGTDPRVPSFAIRRPGADIDVRFAGIPLGHEFSSLALALLQVGGHPVKVSEETAEQIRALPGEYHFETYYSITCQNCPDVVQGLNAMAVLNPGIHHIAIDGAIYPDEVEERQVLAVPNVYLNGEPFEQGRMTVEEILARIDSGATERDAEAANAKEPFDVLVLGGGPAGATAAIYAARKGLRTGLAATRLGGQVQETLAIENFLSLTTTQGPELAKAMENHVRHYDVDVMERMEASGLDADREGGLHTVHFTNGGQLRTRALIIATGAAWLELRVPGDLEYRNKGVTFCPHCDGPLFKGKDVAVIGGGNSGVEAAIDLAGVVRHVTLLELDSQLRADAVLQDALRALPNVDIITSAKTAKINGDGQHVTGLDYDDVAGGTSGHIDISGVFVQIGLVPTSRWVGEALERSPRGEIVVDDRGATSVPGIFAAGDVTTSPYKQILIAAGSGATASLAAFEYLVRSRQLA